MDEQGSVGRTKARIEAFYSALSAGDTDVLPELVDEAYLPHASGLNGMPALEPGREALRRRLAARGAVPHRLHRLIADGELVCAHVRYDGAVPAAGADLFRIGSSGAIAEHWNSRQPIPNDEARGVDRFAGGGDADLPTSAERRAEARAVMREVLLRIWAEGKAELVPTHYSPDYVQHNPDMPGGYDCIRGVVEKEIGPYIARTGGPFPIDIHQLGAEGDLIFVRYSIFMAGIGRVDGSRATNTDIFRIGPDNRMIEHWDVLEIEGEPLPDDRTLF